MKTRKKESRCLQSVGGVCVWVCVCLCVGGRDDLFVFPPTLSN